MYNPKMIVGTELECLLFLFWKAICMIYNSEYYFENYHKLDKMLTKTEMEKPFEKDSSVINTEHHDGNPVPANNNILLASAIPCFIHQLPCFCMLLLNDNEE